MAKKVTAPKTHTPSGGRPREYLAYLNQREMDYLRGLNGGYMERGPRGLPSFAEDKLAGPSGGSPSRGGPGGGPSGPNSGPSGSGSGGKTTSSPGASPSSTAPKSGLDKTQAMMTDANGVSYDYSGNVIKSASPAPKSNSFASPNFPSTVNIDKQIENQTRIKDAISTVRNTPALKNDGVTGFKAQSLGAKPAQTVSVKPTVSQTSVPSKMMSEVDTPYLKAEIERQTQANKARAESSGLFGRVTNTPRDSISAPSRTAPSTTKVTPKERQEIKQAVVGGIGSILKDPVGSAVSGASKAVTSVGDFAKKTFDTIGLADNPEYRSIPGVQNAAAEAAAEAALNYGLSGGVASIAAPIPANSVGMWAGRLSQDPAVQKALDLAESLSRKNARPEDIFNETARISPDYMSGVMRLPFSQQRSMVELADNLDLRRTNPAETVFRTLTGDPKKLGKIIKQDSPILRSYPDLADTPVSGSLLDISDPEGVLRGRYQPRQPSFTERIAVNYPQSDSWLSNAMIKAKGLMDRRNAEAITGSDFRHTLAHELAHAVASREGFPQGTSPEAVARRLSQSNPQASPNSIDDMAWKIYNDTPGEYYARQIADRLGMTPEDVRNYMKSFTMSISPEDFRNMYNAR